MTPERFQRLSAVLQRRQPDLTVVTDSVHKGQNLSAIVRTADAAGIGDMHCAVAERDYHAFRGTAMGSHSWVKVQRYADISAALNKLKKSGFQIVATNLSAQTQDYREVDYCAPTALVLGSEKNGISDAAAALADVHIKIPMMGMVSSYNVSVAAGIVLAEAQHQRQQAGLYDSCRLDDDCYQRTFFEWAHPVMSAYCQQHQLAYPPLRGDGEIDNPSAWYRAVREGSAPRCDHSSG